MKKTIIIPTIMAVLAMVVLVFMLNRNKPLSRQETIVDLLKSRISEQLNDEPEIEILNISAEQLLDDEYEDIDDCITTAEGDKTTSLILENVEISVLNADANTCQIEVMSPDIYAMMLEYSQDKELTAANFDAVLQDMKSQVNSRLKNGDCTLMMVRMELPLNDGEPVLTDEFYNAVYGGMLNALTTLSEEYCAEGDSQ